MRATCRVLVASPSVHSHTYIKGHTSSVEDIAWSPTEETVFASSSVDMTIRIWDTRQAAAALTVKAHDSDVNVISWNALTSYMLASGADDGIFRIWDLRNFGQSTKPVAHFQYHTTPITSIEWCPHEASSLSVSIDGAVTIWDLAVERDAEEEMAIGVGVQDAPGHEELPPQLMFQHMGQTDIKEAHWHRYVPDCAVAVCTLCTTKLLRQPQRPRSLTLSAHTRLFVCLVCMCASFIRIRIRVDKYPECL